MAEKKFLIRHLGNMGDMVFFLPPILKTLKEKHPGCHITVVAPWGYKQTRRRWPTFKKTEFWGNRNQGGFSIHLLLTNPHIDQLVHWHDTKTYLPPETGAAPATKNGRSSKHPICIEDGRTLPTWSKQYYTQQKRNGGYSGVFELDFGLGYKDNPIAKMYAAIGLPRETYSRYRIHLADNDKRIARAVMEQFPRPRIVLLESIEGTSTRGWDPHKVKQLEGAIQRKYGVAPIWFGGKYNRYYQGRPLSLRENIATLVNCDVGIGVMSGPLHFAAAVGLPTLTLYADHPVHRAAPAYFLNPYIKTKKNQHRTILGPTDYSHLKILKNGTTKTNLTPAEWATQKYRGWQHPGRQSTKSGLAAITPAEVMTVLSDMLH